METTEAAPYYYVKDLFDGKGKEGRFKEIKATESWVQFFLYIFSRFRVLSGYFGGTD